MLPDKSFLADLGARVRGLFSGELTLAGGDLPVHLRLIAQPGLALALLSLLRASESLAVVLALETLALVGDQLALFNVELALIGQLLALIRQGLPLVRDPLALSGDLLAAISSPATLIQTPNPPLDPSVDLFAAGRDLLTLPGDRLALLRDPLALLSNQLTLHRDPLALLRTPDRRLQLMFTPVRAHRAYLSSFI